MNTTVNNYPAKAWSPDEAVIQTNERQLEATGGRVYLTRRELHSLLELLDQEAENESKSDTH